MVFGTVVLSYLGLMEFPLPDKIKDDEESVFLGDFGENEILYPTRRRVSNGLSDDFKNVKITEVDSTDSLPIQTNK